jgi:UDP-N-acetylmuramoylalanine--D-glutamate ligase
MIRVAGKHIVVVGAARSGLAVARLLRFKGANVFLTDSGTIGSSIIQQLANDGIDAEQGKHSELAKAGDFLVVSPGVPTQSPLVQYYLVQGKKVFSEIEVASWFNPEALVAVTGTNGKTTVTSWLDHLWGVANREYVVGGNIGLAFSSLLMNRAENVECILEVSSFQLDHIDSFKPKVSIILNITPDHLDRYDNNFSAYAAAKYRIYENQGSGDSLVFNYDDESLRKHILAESFKGESGEPNILAFSTKEDHGLNGVYIHNGKIIHRNESLETKLIEVQQLGLKGQHNTANALAVVAVAMASGIPIESIKTSLSEFKGVAHRMEKVASINGVSYVNDSKATNINAVWYALSAFHEPVVLILGGRDKGNNYRELFDQIHNKVHSVIAIGESRNHIVHELEYMVPHVEAVEYLKEAVGRASELAKKGEVVLLSPACSSFDQFTNYEDRGDQFRSLVLELASKATSMANHNTEAEQGGIS